MLGRRRNLIPYLLLLPGLIWLVFFFAWPLVQVFLASFWSGSVERGYSFSFANWTNYSDAITPVLPHVGRSVLYSLVATVLALLIAYPLAYTIAVRGGRAKNLLLFLVVAPFFTSFLLRTLSWKIILSDSGIIFGPLKDIGLLPDEFRVLATPMAVVAGITYNFLPFMTLPIYVALEKVDFRLVEAARDLYAGPWKRDGTIVGGLVGGLLVAGLGLAFGWSLLVPVLLAAAVGAFIGRCLVSEAFVRVTFPLSLPGVFAGSLLTFIPAMGDYVNAEFLGNPDSRMLGNVIQNRFLTQNDFPEASALSFMLMGGILVIVLIYTRLLGTDQLTGHIPGRT
ncbi:MAG: ABC transporter permease [Candidatus Limnocylindrales bacterium]